MSHYELRPTKVPHNWLEKLNEWNDKTRALQWKGESRNTSDGWKWFSTPIIDGVEIMECVGIATSEQAAKGLAAKLLSEKGKLRKP